MEKKPQGTSAEDRDQDTVTPAKQAAAIIELAAYRDQTEDQEAPQDTIVETISISPIPEDIANYAGNWTAIRYMDGRMQVVVFGPQMEDVTGSPLYENTDALYFAPLPGERFYAA